jgi:hypothetical protein
MLPPSEYGGFNLMYHRHKNLETYQLKSATVRDVTIHLSSEMER